MRNVWTIAERELKSYFSSPVAYGLMVFFALICGFVFFAAVSFMVANAGRFGPANVNEGVIRPLLSNMSVFGLFLIPMITMRLFAEEKRSGTFELLATSPISDWQIALGKWLAALILYLTVVAYTSVNLMIVFMQGNPDWKPVLVGYLGLLLQGAALLAIGTFISTTTRNQIIAGAATFAVCLLLYIMSWLGEFSATAGGKLAAYLSVLTHFEPFSRGLIDTKDLLYFVSLTFLGIFLTTRSLESLRWRA